MPRRYDSDEFDDDTDDSRPLWRNRLITWGLAAVALGLGFLIPYTLYLNGQVTQRFGELRWQIPTRVYARPLVLSPGVAMNAATLKTELAASGYRDDGTGTSPGTYKVQGGTFTISSRGYNDVDGRVAPRQLSVSLSDGQVGSVREGGSRTAVKAARLDPARIATLYGQKQEERRLVRVSETPELLVTGLQAVEDKDFARHHGIDLSGIVRAVWVAVRSGGETRQGASTLTQQLARSGLLGIGKEQTLTRKFNEVLYALIMEARYDKATILEAYLNQVYLGQRGGQAIHGVSSAAEFWFGRDLNALTTEQVALLIGLVKGPSYYDPRRNPERALDRRNFVLGKLRESDLIDDAEYQRALKAPLGVSKTAGLAAANRFPAYIDLVRRQLGHDYPENVLQGAGLNVFTGMSPSAQAYAEGAVAHTIKSLENKRRPELQAGLVVTDVHNGDVLAVIGSRDVAEPGFNRAIEAQRQVGSLLKPFVYLLALAQPDRFSLASWVDDSPVTVKLSRGRNWTPGNADNRSHGTVRLIDALARSYNQATVRVGMQVGPERLTQLINVLAGLKADSNPAVILGATDQSPYGMAQLYQFLASGGEIQPLHAVRGVVDAQGKLLKRYDKNPAPAQEGDSIAANLISVALQQVVSSGTAARLNADGLARLQPAGKTGTSNDGRDSWYAGYTGDHLAVIWMGNDQNEQTGLFGSTGSMRVWSGIFRNLPSKPLHVNNKGLDWQYVEASGSNATDEGCPGARRFPFVVGFAPQYVPCTMPAEATPVEGEGDSQQEGGGWRSWFGIEPKQPEPTTAPPAETPAR
ncbi:penicillin-binding protein [Stenotrophomonas humi]|uniref:Penicillin-binding protein 1B n=1 Tax=Stenotrophomonas humi TaxID=405444 RepID=A0A0R0CGT6_9GAMM|nr:penicillin-binding protein 1B [Stenotrophomonas humi]KRG64881.1 penicillin-binding protein [Stenotrophomonas humi]